MKKGPESAGQAVKNGRLRLPPLKNAPAGTMPSCDGAFSGGGVWICGGAYTNITGKSGLFNAVNAFGGGGAE